MSSFIDSPQEGVLSVPIPIHVRLSAQEFVEQFRDERFELINGRLVEMPLSTSLHSMLCVCLIRWFGNYAETHSLGRVCGPDVKIQFATDTILGPEVSYFSFGRFPVGHRPSYPTPIIPELVVEVRSPSNTWDELFSKVQIYLQAGVLIALIVDEESSTVSIYRPGANQQTLQAHEELTLPDLFPGFAKPISQLFDQ